MKSIVLVIIFSALLASCGFNPIYSSKNSDFEIINIKNNKSYIRSAAAIRCLLFMKWQYKIFFPFLWIVPIPIRDLAYIVISKNRHKIFTKPEICVIPTLNNNND